MLGDCFKYGDEIVTVGALRFDGCERFVMFTDSQNGVGLIDWKSFKQNAVPVAENYVWMQDPPSL